MKPKKVSISCDSNPFYLEFWEPVSRVWKYKFGIEPHLFFIGEKQDAPKSEHGKITIVEPVEGIPIHTQAQWARFHFTQTDLDAVWITSDIDMFPLSKYYFFDMVENVSEDVFISLNSDMRDYFPVCYNMATGRVLKEVLQLEDVFEDDVKKVFKSGNSNSWIVNGTTMENWSIDELYSSNKICQFRSHNPNRVVQFMRPGGYQSARRIDRSDWRYNSVAIKNGWYLDSHSLRPYRQFKEEIEKMLSWMNAK